MGLKDSLKKIEGRFGKGSIMKMSDGNLDIPRISSGSLKLDAILGGGGAKGKIIEIMSKDEGTGKTGIALEFIREVQKGGGVAAIIDAEHALNLTYAKQIGVNVDELFVSQPDNGEQGFEIARELVASGEVDIIVFDSVSALVPKAELDGEVGESKMGLHARMMSQVMRMMTGVSSNNECTLIFINQMRDKIGVMFGDPSTTTGGNALKFYSSQRLQITKSSIKKDGAIIGFTQKIKCIKNKCGVPYKTAEREIIYGVGISKEAELLDVAIEMDLCKRSGSWFSYGDVKLGQGKDKAIDTLKDNPELVDELTSKIRSSL